MNYYKVKLSTNTGKQLVAFLKKCQKADIAADKYAKHMGAVSYVQPNDVFAGGVEYLEFTTKKGKEWREVPTGDPASKLYNPNCLAVPAIKIVPKGVNLELKWDEFIPGGIKRAKRFSLAEIEKAFNADKIRQVREFVNAHLGADSYYYVLVSQFVDMDNKIAKRKPQWFRKAVEAEKRRLSLPVVEMSEFNDIVQCKLPESLMEAKIMGSQPSTPVFFVYDGYFWVSFYCPCTAEGMEEIEKKTFTLTLIAAKRASEV